MFLKTDSKTENDNFRNQFCLKTASMIDFLHGQYLAWPIMFASLKEPLKITLIENLLRPKSCHDSVIGLVFNT